MYGVDVSHYQGAFDFHRARREGFEFAILKATEGHTWVDKTFARNLRKARAAGLIVAAYHYQRADSGARAQAAHIASVVPRDVPVILDVEDGGGGPDLSRAILGHLHDDGYRSPLIYLPAWYWRRIGEPSLAGLPPLWYSRYASNDAGTASELWHAADEWHAQHWDGYGGLHVEILQYSSHARVAGTYPVDANFYRGTRAELGELFGRRAPAPPATSEEDDDMRLTDPVPVPSQAEQGTVGYALHNLLYGVDGQRRDGDIAAALRHMTWRLDSMATSIPTLIAQQGHDPQELAEALRPIIGDVVGPVVEQAVTSALGQDNADQADAIVDAIAAQLAGGAHHD